MRASLPWPDIALATLAGGVTLGVSLLPPTPWLAPELQPLTVALSAGWTVWRLLALDRTWARRRRWHQAPAWVMDAAALPSETLPRWLPAAAGQWLLDQGYAAQTGAFLGRAFRWHAGHTQVLEQALARDGALPVATDVRGGHPALHAVGEAHEQPLVVPWTEMTGHMLITGTTRSGKTRLLEVLAAEVVRGPGAAVILDPKGDRELLARCAAEARRRQRPFALLTPAFPEQSARMNVLDTATTPAEVATRIRALMPSGGARGSDPFFEEYPLALIERLATVQAALGRPWTLEGLYPPAVMRAHLEALLTDYLHHLGISAAPKRGLPELVKQYQHTRTVDLVADALIDDWEKPRDHFTKVTSNLIPAFRGVVGGALGPLFSAIPADITWTRIVEDRMVVYVALASLLLGDIANRIGRVILQDLVSYLGRIYAYGHPATTPPITVLIDEFGDVAFPLFTNALNKGGGANARFILAQQSLADAEAAMGPAQARRVLDNLNTKIWCRLADDRTAKEATEGLGLCTVRLPDDGVGLSYGGVGGLSGNASRRLAGREVPLVRPAWLTALPRGEALVRMKGEVWKLRVPLLTPVPPETLATLGLTALWTALDPAIAEDQAGAEDQAVAEEAAEAEDQAVAEEAAEAEDQAVTDEQAIAEDQAIAAEQAVAEAWTALWTALDPANVDQEHPLTDEGRDGEERVPEEQVSAQDTSVSTAELVSGEASLEREEVAPEEEVSAVAGAGNTMRPPSSQAGQEVPPIDRHAAAPADAPRRALLTSEDPEWERAWRHFPDPVLHHPQSGEVLQYMGSIHEPERGWVHVFRHRHLPGSQQQREWRLKASAGWVPQQPPCHEDKDDTGKH